MTWLYTTNFISNSPLMFQLSLIFHHHHRITEHLLLSILIKFIRTSIMPLVATFIKGKLMRKSSTWLDISHFTFLYLTEMHGKAQYSYLSQFKKYWPLLTQVCTTISAAIIIFYINFNNNRKNHYYHRNSDLTLVCVFFLPTFSLEKV